MPERNPIAPRKRASTNSPTPDAGPRTKSVAAWPYRPFLWAMDLRWTSRWATPWRRSMPSG